MKIKLTIAAAVSVAASALIPFQAFAKAPEYPADSIRIIVPFGAGGGTDAVARMVASGLSERLEIPVNVENRPGAGGVIGHREIANAKTDGSVIGLMTSSLDSYQTLGRGDINYRSYSPIALVNFDPAGIQVSAKSEFDSLPQVLDALKSDPSKYTASASGIGGPWHVAWVKMLLSAEVNPSSVTFIPTTGAGPSLNELIAGAINFAPTSVAEATSLIQAGDVRSLAVMSSKRSPAFPEVPTVEEVTGLSVSAGVWRGFAGPKGMSADAASELTKQIKDIFESESFQSKMSSLGYGLRWEDQSGFEQFMADAYDSTKKTLQSAGLAKN